MNKRLLSELRASAPNRLPDRPPFWFMRQAGRYLPEYRQLRQQEPDFLRFCYSPDLACEATLQPLRRFSPDAAILFSDILVIPDALGCLVHFVEGQGPVLEPLAGATDVGRLKPEQAAEHLEPVIEAVRRIVRNLPAETALIGFAGAPWTVALYMIEGRGGTDGSRVRAMAWAEPETFGTLIGMVVDATVDYLDRQIAAGAESVQLFDSWAGLLAAEQFRRWVIEPTRTIVNRLRERWPDVPVIGFPRAAGVLYGEYVRETGVDAVGVDAAVPPEWAAHELQHRCAVQGNLDNQLLRIGGGALMAATEHLLRELSDGRFIFNLGHGILPDTPPENVMAVAEQVRGFRRTV